MGMFLALICIAVAISGAMAFAFFWPMALVHLRDRHGALHSSFGDFAFASPAALAWLLRGRYRGLRDTGLSGLATPAFLALWSMILALVAAGVLYLIFGTR
ncbi:hypothetical protein [Chiayiivirga flava]|uniref:Uncharacterized protein n=1 Tax=Chiayiivirga flava TaxID=659595 RepID=A0A7W8G198_9GAMM|nr:hypothetical protein [Chiayiivirga flava]MBB5208628.1 hypothetical protein [Chiayiivirga flava]